MTLLAITFCYSVLSALVPIFNAEAYVGAVAVSDAGLWGIAFVAAAGQMVGKTAYFLLGQNSLRWSWIRKKTESERWKARIDTWQRRLGGNPWLATGVLFVSAFFGVPPFAIISVLAGQLRVPLPLFVIVGLIGRFFRFASVLGLVGLFV